MEWWSNGVMEAQHPNTPVLQHSRTEPDAKRWLRSKEHNNAGENYFYC